MSLKQKTIKSLHASFLLEHLGLEGRVLANFKTQLKAEDFINVMDFIEKSLWDVFIEAVNKETLDMVNQYLEPGKEEELSELIKNIITLDLKVSSALKNTLGTSIVAMVELFNIEIN